MLMFREEKSPEDEIKAWQFWHARQHSVKQRILDAGKTNIYIYLLVEKQIYDMPKCALFLTHKKIFMSSLRFFCCISYIY